MNTFLYMCPRIQDKFIEMEALGQGIFDILGLIQSILLNKGFKIL